MTYGTGKYKSAYLANINRNTMDRPGGKIIKTPQGEPTGVLKDEALALIDSRIPEPTDAELDSYMTRASKNAVEHGVISCR
jgi:predicted amidohydrolase YtcJ